MKEHEYYIDENGKWVFTAAYHEARGYCCGQACKHCPFEHEAVPEPKNLHMQYTPKTKDFFQNVFEVVRLIPKGRVTSYGAIAKYLGTGGSARMVGWAMNASHGVNPKIPAHRVVNRNGMLSGKAHFETPTQMEELLLKENIIVKNETILDFEKIFWDPIIELGL